MHVTEHLGFFVQWEILAAIGIPLTGFALAAARHFWKKEKCFIEMKNTINELSQHDNDSNTTHNGFEEELTKLKTDLTEIKIQQTKNEVYLQLLLDDKKIKYSK